jgi:hypothetical protein
MPIESPSMNITHIPQVEVVRADDMEFTDDINQYRKARNQMDTGTVNFDISMYEDFKNILKPMSSTSTILGQSSLSLPQIMNKNKSELPKI